jgi:hypothetical protein
MHIEVFYVRPHDFTLWYILTHLIQLYDNSSLFEKLSNQRLEINQRDPWRYLKYAFRARDASEEVAEEISRRLPQSPSPTTLNARARCAESRNAPHHKIRK